jgi:ubiquitin thioesterase protein OTUB1
MDSGFQLLVVEDFHDVAWDTMMALEQKSIYDSEMLLSRFQSDEISNAIVVLFRFITSAFLQRNADEYCPFIMDYADDMATFCANHVEAMGRESDEIQIIAISKQMKLNIGVVR